MRDEHLRRIAEIEAARKAALEGSIDPRDTRQSLTRSVRSGDSAHLKHQTRPRFPDAPADCLSLSNSKRVHPTIVAIRAQIR